MNDIIIDPNQNAQASADTPALDMGPTQVQAQAPSAAGDVIKESDTDHFVQDVIEMSQQVPVIVDFWAPWCGPCKTLGPMLEKLVKRAGGLIKMVKINVDDNQGLAGQLRVQSVPTVFAFKEGRPVDAFAGALPESQIQAFIDKLIGDAKPPIEAAMEQAHAALKAGDAAAAENMFTAVLSQDASFVPAFAGIVRAIAAQGEFERGREMLDSLDAKTLASSDVQQAVSALDLAEEGCGADPSQTQDLQAAVDRKPKDPEARFALAQALFTLGQHDAAVENLLELVRIDREWNEQSGRKQLIKIFDTLGPTDPLTIDARKRLSAILFS